MAAFTRLDAKALDMLAHDIANWIDRSGDYPMIDVDQDTVRKALPAFLRSMGVDQTTDTPAAAPAAAFAKHTCRNGRGPAFGRLAPAGQCPRCDELHAGAAPREAHPAIKAVQRRRDQEELSSSELRAHFAPGSPHSRGHCGPVCTFGQW